jgi:hypothetical protein
MLFVLIALHRYVRSVCCVLSSKNYQQANSQTDRSAISDVFAGLEQWRAFECEMAERASALTAALKFTDPKRVCLTAREEIYSQPLLVTRNQQRLVF